MSTPLDVAVNLLWCDPGRVGGSEEYLSRQLLGLRRHRELELTMFGLEAYAEAHPELMALHGFVASSISGHQRARRVLAEHRWLAPRTAHADVVHHGGGTMPSVGGRPTVLTIHDLQYIDLPDYTSVFKRRYLRTAVPRSVRRADVVAVPTEFVRTTVVDAFDVAPERVVVVRHGIDASNAELGDPAELRRSYRLGDGPIVVLPAITHPHKGHLFLLDVLARAWTDPELKLVLLGGHGAADAAVERRINELDLGRRVIRPGRVSAADRDGIIALSEALVFPSEYEGFGAPVLEAMSLGTPVVCSDQAALVEVVGTAAVVLPLRVEAWADALTKVSRERTRLVEAGRARAAQFTIDGSGDDIAAAYRLAHEIGRQS